MISNSIYIIISDLHALIIFRRTTEQIKICEKQSQLKFKKYKLQNYNIEHRRQNSENLYIKKKIIIFDVPKFIGILPKKLIK